MMINTGVLMCCSNSEDVNLLSNLFLRYGFGCTVAKSIDNVKKIFEQDKTNKNKFKCIVLGLDFQENQNLQLLQYINALYFSNNQKNTLPIIIAMSLNANNKTIQQLQSYRISVFFKRPLEENRIDYELAVLMYRFKDVLPPKKTIFIEPDEQELMRGNYKLKNGRHESVKITDVSIDGVYVTYYDSQTDNQNKQEDCDFIEHFLFEVPDAIIDTDARIVQKDDGRIYIEFTHFYGDSCKYLLSYIKSKINESVVD